MNDLWLYLTGFLDVYPYLFLQYLPFRHRLRFSFGKTMLLCACVLLPQFYGLVWLSHQPFYTLNLMLAYRLCFMLTLALLTLLFVQDSFFKSLFVYSVMLPYMAFVLCLGSYLVPIIGANAPPYQVSALARAAIVAATYPLVRLFFVRRLVPAMEISDPALWKYACVIPLMLTLISLISFGNDFELAGVPFRAVITSLCIFVGAAFVCLVLLAALQKTRESAEAMEQRKQALRLVELQAERYKNLVQDMDEARRARHDLRHHLSALHALAKEKKLDELESYLQQLGSFPQEQRLALCGNHAADAVMSHYLALAKAEGISLELEMRLNDSLGIDDLDLCVVLGNCMENAIEACRYLPKEKRYVIARGRQIRGNLSLVFVNSFDGAFAQQAGRYASRKLDFRAQGTGLTSVAALAEKYQGELKAEPLDNEFRVSVFLPTGEARLKASGQR